MRMSITDRCNFRCVYCMDPDVRFAAAGELLERSEIARMAAVCAGLGVRKIRVTGGEPTLHPELEGIIADIAAPDGVEVALTTNGSLLTVETARRWKRAGLKRVTVSIDAVTEERFAEVTRSRTGPERVIEGVRAAVEAGLGPVKMNAVVIRGVNEDQVAPLAGLARRLGVEMRFIEFMPLDSSRAWDRGHVVGADEVIARVHAAYPLRGLGREEESSTSEVFEFADGTPGRIGVIAPVTRPFCGACSRLRITADGKVRPCLFSTREWDLRPLLRGGAGDDEIRGFLIDATWTKQAGHGISAAGFAPPERTMSAIGG